jgi:two-component system CheB/CheR fusion protein
MKAANEELQSTNEELRSTMEELMTSKEELQSMYEELQTISQENRHKVEELVQLSSDLQNLLAATHIATLFLDRTLRILRFTPKVGELFNVRTTDQGRPLADFTHRLGYSELLPDAKRVLDQLIPVEREIRDETGQWYLTRILPYRSVEDRIEGIVITFIEITARKYAEEALATAKRYAERIIETLHEPLLVLTPDLRVKSANPDFYEHFQVRRKEPRAG